MTRDETKKILAVLSVAFPNYNPKDKTLAVSLWQKEFENNTYEEVNNAVLLFINTETSGFAPTIGQIKSKITFIEDMNADTEIEAWNKVRKAVKDSGREPEKVFANLPVPIQLTIGSVGNLVEMGLMPSDTFESVEKSHFMRVYRTVLAREHEKRIIPVEIARQIKDKQAELIPQLIDKQNPNTSEEEKAEISEKMAETIKNFLKSNYNL
jgi:hypothetical protein